MFLKRNLQQQKFRPFILAAGILSFVWLVIAGFFSYFYASNHIDNQYIDAEKESRIAMNHFHEGLHRTMNLLQNIPVFISNQEKIQNSLKVLNQDEKLKDMSREDREKYLSQFPKLIKANKELSELANNISVISGFWIMRKDGITIASSNANLPDSLVGSSFQDRKYFQEAISGKTAKQYIIGRYTS